MRAMLFAAGLGTRLRPLTDHMPKALVPVSGRPLLDITIERLKMAGATDIVVNVHHFSSQIIDHLAQHDYGVRIRVSDETAELLDTGGGLKKALPLFEGDAPVLLHNVDILSNAELRAFCRENAQNDVTLLVSPRQTQRYLLFDAAMRLVGWTNIATGEVKELTLPKSNVLAFYLEGGCKAIVRPSGTEPKIKTYITAKAPTREEAETIEQKIYSYFTQSMK